MILPFDNSLGPEKQIRPIRICVFSLISRKLTKNGIWNFIFGFLSPHFPLLKISVHNFVSYSTISPRSVEDIWANHAPQTHASRIFVSIDNGPPGFRWICDTEVTPGIMADVINLRNTLFFCCWEFLEWVGLFWYGECWNTLSFIFVEMVCRTDADRNGCKRTRDNNSVNVAILAALYSYL